MKFYLLFIFILNIISISCQKRDWNNPFDPDCPKELFTPSGFTASQQGSSINLTWSQSNTHISGFRIMRGINDGTWEDVGNVTKENSSWTDINIEGGKKYTYKIVAVAGTNISNEKITSLTPVLPPVLSTTAASAITPTTATSGGIITSDGGSSITARGVCYGTTQTPTISGSKTSDGTGTGDFTSPLTNLTPNTTYYARAYATNSSGAAYGNEITFKTSLVLSMATVTTATPTTVTASGALLGGNVVSDGNATVTERGICYSTTQNPTISSFKVAVGNGTGSYSATVTGLAANTIYYVRAYAINSQGAAYGAQVSFTTSQIISLPTVTTTNAANITSSGATLGGNVTSDGNAAVTERGICYATTQNPTTSNIKVSMGSGTGVFSNSVTGLAINTTYYVRAYAINSQGTAYGNQVTFTTMQNVSMPSVTTLSPNTITANSAVLGGNVTNDGYATVTERGIVYSTTQTPTTTNNKVAMGSGLGAFSNTVTGLLANTTYYVRAFASNSQGTAYGSQVIFSTSTINQTGTFIDQRDSKVYGWVKIGNQIWTTENISYLPFVNQLSDTSSFSTKYYVYNYSGTNVSIAKSTNNYKTYGVLYNWFAAMQNAPSSNFNPSGVKGICPTGWHLPSYAEWEQLEIFLTDNGYGFEGSGDDIGKSLAAKTNWQNYSVPGTIGNDQVSNNSSGFTGLPGGQLNNGSFYEIGSWVYWWCATETSSGKFARYKYLSYVGSILGGMWADKSAACYVRCVKDY